MQLCSIPSSNTYKENRLTSSDFFLGGRSGTRTPKYFVNLMGESKNFKRLEFPLNLLQTYYGNLCDLCPLALFFSDLNFKMVILLSQTGSTPEHFFIKKKALTYKTSYNSYTVKDKQTKLGA
jgi:hypothetical protein